MLQAQRRAAPYWFLESAKLTKSTGEPLRALSELEHALHFSSHADDQEHRKSKAKVRINFTSSFALLMDLQALVIRARWMNESERYQPNEILKAFQAGAEILTM
jgi:serine/threonine-protein kinase ATR